MTSNISSKDVVSEVREVYGRTLDRDAHGTGHYEGCWKDHWACLAEKLLDHIGRITPVETSRCIHDRVICEKCAKMAVNKHLASEDAGPVAAPVETLSITHIFDGEEVVTALVDDGPVWIATFGSYSEADEFVKSLQREPGTTVVGRIRRQSPEEPPPERRETGWLVEDGAGHARPRFRTMDQTGIHWTDDANKALRFARRADAEMFAAGDEDAWRVTQHQWVTVDGDFIHAENGTRDV